MRSLPVRSSETPSQVMAERLLERFGRMLQEIATTDDFDTVVNLPAFQSFIQDTEYILAAHRQEAQADVGVRRLGT